MKCQRCAKQATMHITDVLTEDKFEEHHLCEECAQRYLAQPMAKKGPGPLTEQPADDDDVGPLAQECSVCGIKFVEFRNSGRLGCAHDYDEFREELTPLLLNIHGETKHVGKQPRRQPQTQKRQGELSQLRKQLQQAVQKEAYEEAAKLRDLIRRAEERA